MRSEERIEPTPETAFKSTTDPVALLPPKYQRAAFAIDLGFRLKSGSLMLFASEPLRARGRKNDDPDEERRKARVEAAYDAWRAEMEKRGLSLAPIICVVVDRNPPCEFDRTDRRPMGWTAERLMEGLALYIKVASKSGLDRAA